MIQVHSGTVGVVLAGGAGLTKTTAGVVTLARDNVYVGVTAINGGVLVVDGSTSAGSLVQVNAGGVLEGVGRLNGAVEVLWADTLNPGGPGPGPGSVGVLTAAGSVQFLGSTLFLDALGPTAGVEYDQLRIANSGSITIDPGALVAGFTNRTANGTQLKGIDNQSASAVVGKFTSLVLPAPPQSSPDTILFGRQVVHDALQRRDRPERRQRSGVFRGGDVSNLDGRRQPSGNPRQSLVEPDELARGLGAVPGRHAGVWRSGGRARRASTI